MTDFYREKTATAKKNHKCDQCNHAIHAGKTYIYTAGVSDGDFFIMKEHQDCASAWQELNWGRDHRDLRYDEGAEFLCKDYDLEPGDIEWLKEDYPAVAERLWGKLPVI